jgi:hypothetical protein
MHCDAVVGFQFFTAESQRSPRDAELGLICQLVSKFGVRLEILFLCVLATLREIFL